MDLGALVRAFALRDETTDLGIRALTDRQIIATLTAYEAQQARPKRRGTTYADPTGEQACARADRSRP